MMCKQLIVGMMVWLAASAAAVAGPPTVRMAVGGEAQLDVVIAEGASETVGRMAQELAHKLHRISGAEFAVTTGDGSTGLAVGTLDAFPELELGVVFDPDEPAQGEAYVLRTHDKGIWVIGATDLAVEHAVWDLLYRLGHRQFFPGETWEIVPQIAEPRLAIDVLEKPDFVQRRVSVGHGLLSINREAHQQWQGRNRFRSAMNIAASHAYQAIIRANQEDFDANPQYRALVDGERRGSKFCISNPGLRNLVVEHARRQFHEDPTRQSISMEPSDGGNWCECEPCAELGSISNRVVILANEVAEAINDLNYGPKYVGILAYHMHSTPPSVKVHSNVIVRAATNGVRGGYTHQQLIEAWQQRGATMGVSDFYSVFVWDYSMPARQMASNLPYIRDTLPAFYRANARYFNVAISDNWAPAGIGAYVAARILWDLDEADRIEDLFDDFLERAFGDAREPMHDFFRLIYRVSDNDRRPLIERDMIARMYHHLDRAFEHDADSGVRARLNDLLLYTRYVELYHQYNNTKGDARQEAVEKVLRHAHRMRGTHMVHTRPVLTQITRRDNTVSDPAGERVRVDEPFTDAELAKMLSNGLANNEVIERPFEPVAFSRDLVPATSLNLTSAAPGHIGGPMGRQHFYTWLHDPQEFVLRISGGHRVRWPHLIANVQVRMFAAADLDNPPPQRFYDPWTSTPVRLFVDDSHPTLVAFDDNTPPDESESELQLTSPEAGLHRVDIWPPYNAATVEPVNIEAWTAEASLDLHNRYDGSWSLYFYVPRGTRTVGGFTGSSTGTIRDGDDNVVLGFSDIETPNYFNVPVPDGQDGRLWKFDQCRGERLLMTVPPYLSPKPERLLLPREVIDADTRANSTSNLP